jgi:hypothetical protein
MPFRLPGLTPVAAPVFLLVLSVLALSGCGGEPRAVNSAFPGRTLAQLEARSVSLAELGVRRTATGFQLQGTWHPPAAPVEIPMELIRGLPHVRVRVNGREVSFILDSGSEGTVLEADTALKCGVRTAHGTPGNITISGISGSESALMGTTGRMEIGDWDWEGWPCLVRTNRSGVSGEWSVGERRFSINVLGLDVLRRMCSYVTLDYPAKKVVFGFGGPFRPCGVGRAWNVPMAIKDGLLQVRVGDGRTDWPAVVDTGSTSCLEISNRVAQKCAPDLLADAERSSIVRVGVGLQKPDAGGGIAVGHVRSLEHLGPRLLNVPALLVPDFSKVGTGLFRRFRVTLDFQRSRLWLEDVQR